MQRVFSLLLFVIVARFQTGTALEAELLALRHQLLVVHRPRASRPRPNLIDRLIWIWLYRVWPSCLDALVIVKPATAIRWHRQGFRYYWKQEVTGQARAATDQHGADPPDPPPVQPARAPPQLELAF